MKQTVTFSTFRQAFDNFERAHSFPGAALEALFDYIEELETDTGEDLELDVVALCCDFSHHSSAAAAAIEYGFEPDGENDDDEREQAALEWLRDQTQVIEVTDGSVIIQGF